LQHQQLQAEIMEVIQLLMDTLQLEEAVVPTLILMLQMLEALEAVRQVGIVLLIQGLGLQGRGMPGAMDIGTLAQILEFLEAAAELRK